jgi:ComF family protein
LAHTIRRWKNLPDASLNGAVCELFRKVDWEAWLEDEPSLIIFVPPDAKRMRRRGFHPAGLLAQALSRAIGVSVDSGAVLARSSYASSQGQGRARRRERLRGVFSVDATRVRGARLLLIDDVMTTGATVDTIARACLKSGAASVQVAVLARAPR